MAKLEITKELEEEVISQIAGSDVLELVNYLKGKKDVSEFIIAKDIGGEIQLIRNQLYRLLDHNLVTFWRKKDKQKGWYIYYWTYEPKDIGFLYINLKKKRLDMMKDRLKREESDFFFMCQDNGCIRLDFEKATEFNYQCPECGGMVVQQDNSRTKDHLREQIKEIEKELEELKKTPPIKINENKDEKSLKIEKKAKSENKTTPKPKNKKSKEKTNSKKKKTKK